MSRWSSVVGILSSIPSDLYVWVDRPICPCRIDPAYPPEPPSSDAEVSSSGYSSSSSAAIRSAGPDFRDAFYAASIARGASSFWIASVRAFSASMGLGDASMAKAFWKYWAAAVRFVSSRISSESSRGSGHERPFWSFPGAGRRCSKTSSRILPSGCADRFAPSISASSFNSVECLSSLLTSFEVTIATTQSSARVVNFIASASAETRKLHVSRKRFSAEEVSLKVRNWSSSSESSLNRARIAPSFLAERRSSDT